MSIRSAQLTRTDLTVLHVARGFSAQPTLGACLDGADVLELSLAEALVTRARPDVVWISTATGDGVQSLRERFPEASILATPDPRGGESRARLLASGADLVIADDGVMATAAAIEALAHTRNYDLGNF